MSKHRETGALGETTRAPAPAEAESPPAAPRRGRRALAAHGDCIIVGRNADLILAEHRPLKLFVYADLESRLRRCRERSSDDERFTPRELERKLRQVDQHRARHHAMLSDLPWGETGGVSPVREHHRPVPEDAGPPGGGVCPLLVLPAGDPLTRARKRDCRKSLRLQVFPPTHMPPGKTGQNLIRACGRELRESVSTS